jgi:hypothetical protein
MNAVRWKNAILPLGKRLLDSFYLASGRLYGDFKNLSSEVSIKPQMTKMNRTTFSGWFFLQMILSVLKL